MRRRFGFMSTGLLIVTAMGCQIIAGLDDHQLASDPSGDGAVDAAPSGDEATVGFTMTTVSSLAVLPGGSGSAQITVTRTGGFSNPIAFAVTGLPTGVTTDPLQIAANQTTGSLTFHVAPANEQSASPLTISAVAAGAVDTALMNFYVRGPAGTPDLTFGNQGEAHDTGFLPTDGALDPNDNVIVVGVSTSTPGEFASVRLLTTGVLDAKLGTISQMFSQPAVSFRAFPLASGSILYAGALASGAEYLRVNAMGALDTTFSPDGSIGFYDNNPFTVFAADSTGFTYSAGNVTKNTSAILFIQRRDASGTIDSTYGGTFPIGAGASTVTDAIVQPDGKLVTVSNALLNTNLLVSPACALNRFTSVGTLDNSFGVAGYVAPTDNSSNGRIALAPDGSFFVLTTGGFGRGLFHFSSAGVLDKTFAAGAGKLSVVASDLAVQADGNVVLLGVLTRENSSDSGTYSVLQVERVTATGIVDTAFGTSGFAQTFLSGDQTDANKGGSEAPVAIRIQSDGRIVLIGQLQGASQGTDGSGAVIDRFWN